MNRSMWKTTLREIKASLGRYLAIFAITALGVGFFAGLKVTREAMVNSADLFIAEHDMYDFRLISTLGLTDGDVAAIRALPGVEHACGAYQADAVVETGDSGDYVVHFISLDENINTLKLTAGRLPTAADEVVVDAKYCPEDMLGATIRILEGNTEDTLKYFCEREFTVVGIAYSPLYLNYERGTSAVGSGSVSHCYYVLPDAFDLDVYTDIYLTLSGKAAIYSEDYDSLIDRYKQPVEDALKERAAIRYNGLFGDAESELNDAKAKLLDAKDRLSDAKQKLEDGKKEIAENLEKIEAAETEVKEKEAELLDAKKELAENEQALLEAEAAFKEQEATYGPLAEFNPEIKAQLDAARARLLASRQQLEAAKEAITEGEAQIADAKSQIEKGKREIEDAQKEIADGEAELSEKETELEDAKVLVADAEKELADFKAPSTYLLTRDENIGYACFESDSKIVDGIAVVFPVFFFLVAALVCVTTMSRMIEEQRTQIGILKALGYSEATVMSKYMIYSGSASVLGCIMGFFAGCYAFPKIIWIAYGLMYGFSNISFIFNGLLFTVSLAVSLLCSVGTTYISCRHELHQPSAELIRPKAPKNGKRILLERVTFIWRRIRFLHKVSIRNIFRYKGRFIMMLLGIGGCTGLIITGFGIRDSISELADVQYTKIQVYDELINFSEEMDDEQLFGFMEEFGDYVEEFMPVYQVSVDPVNTVSTRSIILQAPAREDGLTNVLLLHDETGRQLPYPKAGEVILSRNAAQKNGLKTGDALVLRDSDFNEYRLTVSGICDNYFNIYAYICPATCEAALGMEIKYKTAFVCIKDGVDLHEAAAAFAGNDKVGSVSVNADTRERFSNMMKAMDYIVVLVIVCAAALAFIVLYNLTNINITERIREIATIKVLGFYPGETAAYVFRENLALTVIGAFVGIPIGILLHRFVMSNIKIDMVSFDVHIKAVSFLYALLFTLAFAVLVDIVMFFKLKRINMAESLKSVE